jgi:hypothetical protein
MLRQFDPRYLFLTFQNPDLCILGFVQLGLDNDAAGIASLEGLFCAEDGMHLRKLQVLSPSHLPGTCHPG